MVLMRGLHRFEDALIVAILLGMMVLAVAQILLRNLAGTSLVWIDPLLQNAVLWIGMLGAMIASRKDEHISIDVASQLLPPFLHRWLLSIVDLFTSAICGVAAWFSLMSVRDEASFGMMAFASVPAWWLQVIVPLGFGSIALRYAILFCMGLVGRRPMASKVPESTVPESKGPAS